MSGTSAGHFGKINIPVDGVSIQKDPVTGELSAAVGSISFDNTTRDLTFVPGDGSAAQTVNLGVIPVDTRITGGSFDSSTSVLTLTDNDPASQDIDVDLSAMMGRSEDPGNILSNGGDGKPFLSAADISGLSQTHNNAFGSQLIKAFTPAGGSSVNLVAASDLDNQWFGLDSSSNGIYIKPQICRLKIGSMVTPSGNGWGAVSSLQPPLPNYNPLGAAVSSDSILIPYEGWYRISAAFNYSDNNSRRISFRERFTVNGSLPAGHSSFSGGSYIRVASGHTNAGSSWSDVAYLSVGDVLSAQVQRASSAGQATLSSGMLMIERVGGLS